MKRTDYETLAMEEIIVEMENGFLVGSADVQNPNDTKFGLIDNQTINTGTTTGALTISISVVAGSRTVRL